MTWNVVIIGICLSVLGIAIIYQFRRSSHEKDEEGDKEYGIDVLSSEVKDYFNYTLNTNLNDAKDGNSEYIKRQHQKTELRKALRECGYGDLAAKKYVKEHIREWLINTRRITENDINRIVSFNSPDKLTSELRFELLMFIYKRDYGSDGFCQMLKEFDEVQEIRNIEEREAIYETDISELYLQKMPHLTFSEKMEFITQKIYQKYKGHGCIDELRDMDIDGVSGGVSGNCSEAAGFLRPEESNYNSVWVFVKGRMIRLACIGFNNEHELERVCKNVYRYGNPGQLSASRGYIANEMKDGSRVIVVRPPFSEGWAFFIRKFGKGNLLSIDELVTGENAATVKEFLRLMIQSCQVFGITGEQGCGKTTLLKSLIQYIPSSYTLRIQELVFELHLREIYPFRNIVSFRETATVTGRAGLDIQKKTDGTVNIIGEVASAQVASWLVMVAQVASKFTIFTHHAKTARGLVMALRNDLMMEGGFHDEDIAEEQVRRAVRFDVHMARRNDGYRYIERISEIMANKGDGIEEREIISFSEDGYYIAEALSKTTFDEMYRQLDKFDREILNRDYAGLRRENLCGKAV